MNAISPDQCSILVVLMGALGDVARGLTIVHELRLRIPKCRITWLVEPKCKSLVALHPHIDRVVCFERRKGVGALFALRRELRQEKFDISLDLQRHFKSGFFSWLSAAPRRIGFHRADAKEGNWIFNNENIPERGEQYSKILQYHDFVVSIEPKGASSRLEHSAFVSGFENIDCAAALDKFPDLKSQSNIGCVLGSTWSSKDWLPSGYHQLLELILAQGFTPVLLGDSSQMALASELHTKLPRVLNLVGKTSIPELVQVLRLLRVCCGPDSGPGHLASAVGTPYVALFGPTNPTRVAPYGNEELVVTSTIGCAPCYYRRCPGLNKLCMRLITPEQVMRAINSALRKAD